MLCFRAFSEMSQASLILSIIGFTVRERRFKCKGGFLTQSFILLILQKKSNLHNKFQYKALIITYTRKRKCHFSKGREAGLYKLLLLNDTCCLGVFLDGPKRYFLYAFMLVLNILKQALYKM